jgi:PqqA peptide cyclase
MDDLHLSPSLGPTAGETYAIPLAVLAELTHRCPLQCPYCSNPLILDPSSKELSTAEWLRVIDELAEIGVLQIHFSGGEPAARKDLEQLVAAANRAGLYTNLITSAVMLDRKRLEALADAGLNHVQISFQGAEAGIADRVGRYKNGHAKKLQVAAWVRELDLPLTVNAVMHRQNLDQLPGMIDLAVALGARRIEVANVQYYGWALKNRRALMPAPAQVDECLRVVEAARLRLHGVLEIDHVLPDYYADRPKACMGGWARQFFNISPQGKVLPCHAAETITTLHFESVRDRSIADIWHHSDAFNMFRGTGWMRDPCRTCVHQAEDFGGCRCQAFALTGDAHATDPACALSSRHVEIFKVAETEAAEEADRFTYRNYSGGTVEKGDF